MEEYQCRLCREPPEFYGYCRFHREKANPRPVYPLLKDVTKKRIKTTRKYNVTFLAATVASIGSVEGHIPEDAILGTAFRSTKTRGVKAWLRIEFFPAIPIDSISITEGNSITSVSIWFDTVEKTTDLESLMKVYSILGPQSKSFEFNDHLARMVKINGFDHFGMKKVSVFVKKTLFRSLDLRLLAALGVIRRYKPTTYEKVDQLMHEKGIPPELKNRLYIALSMMSK